MTFKSSVANERAQPQTIVAREHKQENEFATRLDALLHESLSNLSTQPITQMAELIRTTRGKPKPLTPAHEKALQYIVDGKMHDPVAAFEDARKIALETNSPDARDVMRQAGEVMVRDAKDKRNTEMARLAALEAERSDGSTARADGQRNQAMRTSLGRQAESGAANRDKTSELIQHAQALSTSGNHAGAATAMLDLIDLAKQSGDHKLASMAATKAVDYLGQLRSKAKQSDPKLAAHINATHAKWNPPDGGRTPRAHIEQMITLLKKSKREPGVDKVLEMNAAMIHDYAKGRPAASASGITPTVAASAAAPVVMTAAERFEHHQRTGLEAFAAGDLQTSKREFTAALQTASEDSQRVRAQSNLSILAEREGDLDTAIEHMHALRTGAKGALSPDANVHFRLGYLTLQRAETWSKSGQIGAVRVEQEAGDLRVDVPAFEDLRLAQQAYADALRTLAGTPMKDEQKLAMQKHATNELIRIPMAAQVTAGETQIAAARILYQGRIARGERLPEGASEIGASLNPAFVAAMRPVVEGAGADLFQWQKWVIDFSL